VTRRQLVLPALAGTIVFVGYTVFSALQWASHAVISWDLGIFTQLAKQYATFSAPIVTIKGPDFNLLGDHFHPLLVVLGPVYALFPHAFTLLVVQNLLFAAAAAIVAATAIRVLGPTLGVLFALAFGFSWGLQYAVEVQFHEVSFAVLLLAVSLGAILAEKWTTAVVAGALLVFVKEDLGLTVVALGIVLALRSRKPIGLWLSIWGAAWFFIATFVVIPLLNSNGTWAYSSQLDPGSIFSDPAATFAPEKLHTLLLLILVTAGIALRSPLSLVLLPTLAWRFLSENSGFWGPSWHYSAVLMPIAFIAALDGIRLSRAASWRLIRIYARAALPIVLAASLVLLFILPLHKLANPTGEFADARAASSTAALASIPAGSVVETDVGLIDYLVDANQVYWIGNSNPVPDYMLIDRKAGGTPKEWGDATQVGERLHPEAEFTLIYARDGYEVAKRVIPGG
jgi:uncharacterized membrane protein